VVDEQITLSRRIKKQKKNKKSFADGSANVGKIKNDLPMVRQTPK